MRLYEITVPLIEAGRNIHLVVASPTAMDAKVAARQMLADAAMRSSSECDFDLTDFRAREIVTFATGPELE